MIFSICLVSPVAAPANCAYESEHRRQSGRALGLLLLWNNAIVAKMLSLQQPILDVASAVNPGLHSAVTGASPPDEDLYTA